MSFLADLHLHSRYAMGVSKALDIETLARGAQAKGIDLLATGDFTHPAWQAELKRELVPVGDTELFAWRGAPELADSAAEDRAAGVEPLFMLGTEVSCVYQQEGRTHRLHLLIHAPSFDAVERLTTALAPYGKLASDGRPTLSLSGRQVVEAALSTDPRCVVTAAHAWTPWYSVYGSKGGFDSLAECFGDMLPHVSAVETGLSSDPSMNWRVPELDSLAIVSYSDAHSAPRLGRELTAFEAELSYEGYRRALGEGGIAYTVEFHPEEGKYHLDGHRKCGVCQEPSLTLERGEACPVCGRGITVGVANRMEALSGRPLSVELGEDGWLRDPSGVRPAFRRLVPLTQVLAEALGRGEQTKTVRAAYEALIAQVGPEIPVLMDAPLDAIARASGERVAEGVGRVRAGELAIEPGYDGVYGTVRIWPEGLACPLGGGRGC